MFQGINTIRKVTLSTVWFYRIVGNIRRKSQEGMMVAGKIFFPDL